jgi:hypothetical protein
MFAVVKFSATVARIPSGAAVGLALVLGAGGAAAQESNPTLRATASFAGGYGETVEPAVVVPVSQLGAPFSSLSASASALYDFSTNMKDTLNYSFSANLPLTNDFSLLAIPLSYSNRLDETLRIKLSAKTTLTLGANMTGAPTNTFLASTDPEDTAILAQPTGYAYHLTLSGRESISTTIFGSATAMESTSLLTNIPITSSTNVTPRTYNINNSVTLSRPWTPRDTASVIGSLGVTAFTYGEGNPNVIDPRESLTGQISARLKHQWTATLSTSGTLGLMAVTSSSAYQPLFGPTGSATLTYSTEVGNLSLNYSYRPQLNVYLASISIVNQGTLRLSLPVPGTDLAASGSMGILYGEQIQTDGTLSLPYDTLSADAGLTWSPSIFITGLTATARYQYSKNDRNDDPTQSSTRLTVSLGLSYSYSNGPPGKTIVTDVYEEDLEPGGAGFAAHPMEPPEETAPPEEPTQEGGPPAPP